MYALRKASRLATAGKRCFGNHPQLDEIRQKYYSNPATGADNPTYLKEPQDKVIFGIATGGVIVGIITILGGLYNMANGINKI